MPINPLTVRSMLVEVGDELGAELGLAEVLDGWQWDRYAEPTSVIVGRGQRRQDLSLDGTVLAGLPIGPVWQVCLGPGYREVVDSVRFDEPPGWDSRSTRRGRLITLAPQSASMAEIATDWFPPGAVHDIRASPAAGQAHAPPRPCEVSTAGPRALSPAASGCWRPRPQMEEPARAPAPGPRSRPAMRDAVGPGHGAAGAI